MKPITPAFPSHPLYGQPVVFAKDQPEYFNLPAARLLDGTVITRWRLSWRERFRLLFSGNLWLTVLTFNKPLQPIRLETEEPIHLIAKVNE